MKIGPLHFDADSLAWGRWFLLHVEVPWSRCVREYDAPRRIYLSLGSWNLIVALNRDGMVQKRPYDYHVWGWWVVSRRKPL